MQNTLPNRGIEWRAGHLILLDQRILPRKVEFLSINNVADVYDAIKNMVVRGAPAIGISAAYGVVLSAIQHNDSDAANVKKKIAKDIQMLMTARPTADNLKWALERMQLCLQIDSKDLFQALEDEAKLIHAEDIAANKTMGELGAAFIDQHSTVMTHCNAGALATGGYGTALGVIHTAYDQGKIDNVFANETRPWFQGARLTAWELQQENIPVRLICDSAAASAIQAHNVDWIVVGADRVTANGDVANKVGTYSLAVLAKHAGKKFMVVAPTSTIDLDTATGDDIIIEQRHSEEVTHIADKAMACEGVNVWNPVFDVTPAELVDVLVTECGAIENPNKDKIEQLFGKSHTK